MKEKHFYLISLEFLGYRYHGWQKQNLKERPLKTVQYMLERTLNFIFKHDDFQTLAAGRTDAMVSSLEHISKLSMSKPIICEQLLEELNQNLPADIRAVSVTESSKEFNVLGTLSKEYHYYFSNDKKVHPYSAPFLANFNSPLNTELMCKAAKLFEGTHCFRAYCFRPRASQNFTRTIKSAEILKNDHLKASFFPENSYYLKIIGKGFVHHQVRIMMGTLINIGLEKISLDDVKNSLLKNQDSIGFVAPASGLHLIKTSFNL